MSILVTGGAGYIGSHMTLTLLAAGERVVVLDNLSTGFDWAVPNGATLLVGDCGDQALVSQVIQNHGVETIIHFAASTVVSESVADPLGYYRNNIVNSRNLIEVAARLGIKHFVFSSTAAVYGDPAQLPVSENDPVAPLSPYGWSKLMTESILRNPGAAQGIKHVILRYFNVAGADPQLRAGQSTRNATHLIKRAAQAALGQRSKLEVFGTDYPTHDGTCVRDYIHVSDLSDVHWAALSYLRRGEPSITLNCGYGRGYSVLDVIEAVKKVAKTDFPLEFRGRRAGDSAELIAASNRVRAALCWTPRLDDLSIIVRDALSWETNLLAKTPTSDWSNNYE